MKINKIILNENSDNIQNADLIIFEKDIELEDLEKIIILTKQKEDFNTEDIFKAIKMFFPIKKVIWLGDIKIINY